MGTAIKQPVPDRVKPSFVIFDTRALWRSGLSDAQGWASECPDVKKITKDDLTLSGTGCSIAVPIWQQWASKGQLLASVKCNMVCCVFICGAASCKRRSTARSPWWRRRVVNPPVNCLITYLLWRRQTLLSSRASLIRWPTIMQVTRCFCCFSPGETVWRSDHVMPCSH